LYKVTILKFEIASGQAGCRKRRKTYNMKLKTETVEFVNMITSR